MPFFPFLDFTCHFARVAPAEIVEMPEGVEREDQVPDGERAEVDEHPADVADAVGGYDDQDAGEAEDETEEDEGDEGRGGVGYGCFDCDGDFCFVSVCIFDSRSWKR